MAKQTPQRKNLEKLQRKLHPSGKGQIEVNSPRQWILSKRCRTSRHSLHRETDFPSRNQQHAMSRIQPKFPTTSTPHGSRNTNPSSQRSHNQRYQESHPRGLQILRPSLKKHEVAQNTQVHKRNTKGTRHHQRRRSNILLHPRYHIQPETQKQNMHKEV